MNSNYSLCLKMAYVLFFHHRLKCPSVNSITKQMLRRINHALTASVAFIRKNAENRESFPNANLLFMIPLPATVYEYPTFFIISFLPSLQFNLFRFCQSQITEKGMLLTCLTPPDLANPCNGFNSSKYNSECYTNEP